jgi:molecular chaperone DnaK (HSP70)
MTQVVLGIDYGTCYSCVSFYTDKEFKVIPNENGELTTASALYFDPYSTDILYGNIAKNYSSPNTFTNLKRLIGKDLNKLTESPDLFYFFKDNIIVNGKFQVNYNNKVCLFSVEELIVVYLNYLKRFSCDFLNKNITNLIDIVITIPAYYSDAQREIIKECCSKVKLNVLRIINEPTSAALAYTKFLIDKDTQEENVLVFDCGGGTTDLSFLNMDYINDFYQVKNVIGNNFLGGEDITSILTDYIATQYNIKNTFKLKKLVENLKKELSFQESAIIEINDLYIKISRLKFKDILKHFFNKIRKLIQVLVNEIKEQIDKVIFIGGTTRIPYIKQIFKEILGETIAICSDIDPDQTVSLGAATQGALLNKLFESEENDTILLDIIPLSIGIETFGGIMAPIVSRNTLIPISRTKEFTNTDLDTEIDIHIYQGERKLVCDNFYLTSFKLTVPEAEKGTLLIQVTFNIDTDSIITATANIKGQEENSEIKITKEIVNNVLSDINLEEILINAQEHKLFDSEISNKILSKIELYDSFKKLLGIFHEKRDVILDNKKEDENFLFSQLNQLFNETFYIIENYQDYTPLELKEIKETFEAEWHKLLFSIPNLFKDSEGLIINTSSFTNIE